MAASRRATAGDDGLERALRFASRRNASTSSRRRTRDDAGRETLQGLGGDVRGGGLELVGELVDDLDHLRLELFHLAEGLPLRVRAGRVVGVAVAGTAVLRLLADDVKHPATHVPDHELCDGEGGTGGRRGGETERA